MTKHSQFLIHSIFLILLFLVLPKASKVFLSPLSPNMLVFPSQWRLFCKLHQPHCPRLDRISPLDISILNSLLPSLSCCFMFFDHPYSSALRHVASALYRALSACIHSISTALPLIAPIVLHLPPCLPAPSFLRPASSSGFGLEGRKLHAALLVNCVNLLHHLN